MIPILWILHWRKYKMLFAKQNVKHGSTEKRRKEEIKKGWKEWTKERQWKQTRVTRILPLLFYSYMMIRMSTDVKFSSYQIPLPAERVHRILVQKPRSFWPAPRITTSDLGRSNFLNNRGVIFSYSQAIIFVRLYSEHAQSDEKFVNRGLPVLDLPKGQPKGRDSWCWPKASRPLG